MALSDPVTQDDNSWWIVWPDAQHDTGKAVQSSTPPKLTGEETLTGPFSTRTALNNWVNAHTGKIPQLPGPPSPSSWITGLGGHLASGIEGGAVAFIKDLWNVIVGPILVLVGVAVALWVLAVYFKNDIISLGATVAKAAAL